MFNLRCSHTDDTEEEKLSLTKHQDDLEESGDALPGDQCNSMLKDENEEVAKQIQEEGQSSVLQTSFNVLNLIQGMMLSIVSNEN